MTDHYRSVMSTASLALSGLACLLAVPGSLQAAQPVIDTVNVAYFLEWATPMQIAKVDGQFDAAMDARVNWADFVTGTEMTDAMQAGDIDIAYSQGLAPFANAVNAGVPITLVGVAVAYGANDDCIIRDDAGIDSTNAHELEGQSVAVPPNTMADFGFRMTMNALGVDTDTMHIIDQQPPDGATALLDGHVVMACGFGAESLATMQKVGSSLLTPEEKVEAGIDSFDVISARNDFLESNPGLVRRFLEVTHGANAAFATDPSRIDVIARDAGLTIEKARQQLAGFEFPDVETQRDHYFGENGLALDMLGFMGQLFATDDIPALSDYRSVIDSSLLE